MDDLSIAGLAGMVLTRAAAENNPCTVFSWLSTTCSASSAVFKVVATVEWLDLHIIAALLKTAAGLKSEWETMAMKNSEAWYINDAASCTTPETFVGFAPLCDGLFEEASLSVAFTTL
jgi:hypothetical protein